jgi:hypothetical protein
MNAPIDSAIMIKVGKKEAYLRNLKRCLAVKICPKCGGNLSCTSDAIGHEYRCLTATCSFTHAE